MYNKTIIRFGFCDIQNNQGLGKGYQPQPSAFWISQKPQPIISMITDRIGRHEVLLPINHKKYNFRGKKNSQVMEDRENLH